MKLQFKDVTIELMPTVCRNLSNYIQLGDLPESGGILLGEYFPEKKEYVITEATIPNSKDKCGAAFFVRDMSAAQKIIDKRWKDSQGIINYLGEWHTHGCDIPVPSETDKKLIQTIYKDKSNVWANIIILILGRKACFVGISDESSRGTVIESKYIGGEEYAYLFNRQED